MAGIGGISSTLAALFKDPRPRQNYIVLAGRPSPGLAVVRNGATVRKWDVQNGYGLAGASLIYHGEELSTFEVDISVWLDSHFADWRYFAAALVPPETKKALDANVGLDSLALGISHPVLDDLPRPVQQCVVKSVSQWEQDDTGLFTRTISFTEYRAPVAAVARVKEGPPAVNNVVAADNDPGAQRRAANEARIKELNGIADGLIKASIP